MRGLDPRIAGTSPAMTITHLLKKKKRATGALYEAIVLKLLFRRRSLALLLLLHFLA
jgi:hypothetical protein